MFDHKRNKQIQTDFWFKKTRFSSVKQIELLVTKLFGFKIQSRLLVLHCALSGPMKMKNAAHSPNMPDFPPKTGMSYTMLERFVKWVETLPENIYLDSYSKRMSQKWYQLFINEELKKLIYFFTCILPYYVTHEITKEFWKNSHFENMTAGFLLWGQKTLEIPLKRFQQWHYLFSPILTL